MSALSDLAEIVRNCDTGFLDTYDASATPDDIADRLYAAVLAEVRREDAALVEHAACDADFTESPSYIAGLRAAVNLLTRATGENAAASGCRARVLADVDRLLEAQRRQHAGRHIFSEGIEHARAAIAELAGQPAEKATATAPTATPFFQVGRTYSREHHGRSIQFLIDCISTPPDGSWRIARGWRRTEDCDWEPMDSDDFTGWTDLTEGGDCRG